MGDLLGRKWNFVITSTLIIIGCLGAATASAGYLVNGNLAPNGLWADNAALPSGSWNDVYGQVFVWRGILGLGVGGAVFECLNASLGWVSVYFALAGEYPFASTITHLFIPF